MILLLVTTYFCIDKIKLSMRLSSLYPFLLGETHFHLGGDFNSFSQSYMGSQEWGTESWQDTKQYLINTCNKSGNFRTF